MQNVRYTIYDIVSKTVILIKENEVIKKSKELNFDYTALSKLGKSVNHIADRYIDVKDKNKIFTLVNVDTGQEYDCITNKTFFLYFDLGYSEPQAKYIYCLKTKKQKYATIQGAVYYLKNANIQSRPKRMKAKSTVIEQILKKSSVNASIKRRHLLRVGRALKLHNTTGSKSAAELLGISNDDFIKYIESKFTRGMNWGNKNLWHIDHIKPCSKFDLSNESELKQCFHYTNMQPIWKTNKIASQFSVADYYKGNLNKSNTGIEYDYHMAEEIKKQFPESKVVDFCAELFKRGIRKVVI